MSWHFLEQVASQHLHHILVSQDNKYRDKIKLKTVA